MERLTEAIEKYKKLSEEKDCLARTFRGFRDYGNPKSTITSGAENNQNLSEEYAQLAEWLEELSQYKELLPTPQMVKDLINMNRKHEKNALENAHIVDDYRKKQDQGLLIELPCKVGDKLYQIKKDELYELILIGIVYDEANKEWLLELAVQVGLEWHKIIRTKERIGKTIFLTRSEAEEALAKMGGSHDRA